MVIKTAIKEIPWDFSGENLGLKSFETPSRLTSFFHGTLEEHISDIPGAMSRDPRGSQQGKVM